MRMEVASTRRTTSPGASLRPAAAAHAARAGIVAGADLQRQGHEVVVVEPQLDPVARVDGPQGDGGRQAVEVGPPPGRR